MEVAGAAKNIANLFSGQSSGRTVASAGRSSGRVASRTDVNKILAKHFRSHPRYRDLSMGERQRLYLLAGALINSGATATDALAITHGVAHDPSRRLVLGRILEQGARATADDLLKGRIKVRPLLPRS